MKSTIFNINEYELKLTLPIGLSNRGPNACHLTSNVNRPDTSTAPYEPRLRPEIVERQALMYEKIPHRALVGFS